MARTNTRRMHVLRDAFKAESAAKDAPCWICGLPVDYGAGGRDFTNEDRFQLDHLHPVSLRPDLQEDPTFFRASHASCNQERGNTSPDLGIGIPSQQWW